MTHHQTSSVIPPAGLREGAVIDFEPSADAPAGHARDWRLQLAEQCPWQVIGITVERRRFDSEDRIYVKMQSIGRHGGLAFMTLPYDEQSMRLTPAAEAAQKADPVFPEAGSRVLLHESDDPAVPSFRDGLWEVEKSFNKAAADGRDALHLSLKSIGRRNQSYINVAFNAATMTPVIPAHLQQGHIVDVAIARDVPVMKSMAIKKRNAAR